MHRELRRAHLVVDRAHGPIGALSGKQLLEQPPGRRLFNVTLFELASYYIRLARLFRTDYSQDSHGHNYEWTRKCTDSLEVRTAIQSAIPIFHGHVLQKFRQTVPNDVKILPVIHRFSRNHPVNHATRTQQIRCMRGRPMAKHVQYMINFFFRKRWVPYCKQALPHSLDRRRKLLCAGI